ncbi:Coiled-coil domain-containing protein 47 [Borealophlyctis nickersoniae]|nr:Coiled-coil domain-containing protein 47 [Borealophlyctis nickersoniae]
MKVTLRSLLLFLFVLLAFAAVARAESDEDLEDEDEETTTPAKQPPLFNQAPRPPPGQRRLDWSKFSWSDFQMEFYLLGGLVLVVVLQRAGQNKNAEIAKNWARATLPVWERNFSLIGDSGHSLIRDGPRDFLIYFSGRVHVKSIHGVLHLAARTDIIQRVVDLLKPKGACDKLTIRATLNKEESDPIIFAILPTSSAPEVVKERWDLNDFAIKRDLAGFPKQYYSLYTDSPEFAGILWDDANFKKAIWSSLGLDEQGNGQPLEKPLIERIILSDLPQEQPQKVEDLSECNKELEFVFRLPNLARLSQEEQASLMAQAELVLDTIDHVGQHGKLSAESRAKAKKLRQVAEEAILKATAEERKAELAKKKLQEKRARDEQVAKLSPEEQRRYEEKERKKAAKEAQKKALKKGKMIMK